MQGFDHAAPQDRDAAAAQGKRGTAPLDEGYWLLPALLLLALLAFRRGVLAVALAAVNVFGGFLVTRRMLEMFKKRPEPKQESEKP